MKTHYTNLPEALQKQTCILCRWAGKEPHNTLILHDKTIEEAVATAKEFGYVSPKWWEFWKGKLHVATMRGWIVYVR